MFRLPSLSVVCALVCVSSVAHSEVTFEERPGRVAVKINGGLFTEYCYGDAPGVHYWPLLGPGGVKMTRSFPMETVGNEETDHKHHRSLWFAHGLVNGVDYWSDPPAPGGKPRLPVGRIEHTKVISMKAGKKAGTLTTAQKWIAPDDTLTLNSVQALTVHDGPATERIIDFDVTLTAGEKEVVFGETKEGTAALRIAETMRFQGPKRAPGRGHIISSAGLEDDKVWGTQANWVTMSGPVGDEEFAITFMDHPSNPHHPTRWHARTYGLFAANPFAGSAMDKELPKDSGSYTLKPGESVTFKYRILITKGPAANAHQNERYEEYAKAVR